MAEAPTRRRRLQGARAQPARPSETTGRHIPGQTGAASRSALFSALIAVLVGWNWARLELPRVSLGVFVLMAALGIAPALLPARRWRFAAAAAAFLAAASIALDVR